VTEPAVRTCQRCGYSAATNAGFCRRCGLPYGAAPVVVSEDAPAECPVCYAKADRRGMWPAPGGGWTTYERHAYDHEQRPVGDDDWLETLRDGDDIVIDRWRAPFDLTRRYLVTGQWVGGKDRTYAHNAVVLAMADASGSHSASTAPAPEKAHGGSRFGFLRRGGGEPGPQEDPEALKKGADMVAARRALAAVRERYLAGSRR
jgi:hypothetical protein